MPSASWLNGWIAGDIVTAAELKKSVGSVFDQTLSIATATIDTGAIIPSTYAHLLVVVYARGDTAATNIQVSMRFNNDSAANYDWEQVGANINTASGSEGAGATSIKVGECAANTAPASVFDSCFIAVPQYAGTTGQKTSLALNGLKTGTTSGSFFGRSTAGWWRSTAAITRITLFPTAGNFQIGTRATVYVMGA